MLILYNLFIFVYPFEIKVALIIHFWISRVLLCQLILLESASFNLGIFIQTMDFLSRLLVEIWSPDWPIINGHKRIYCILMSSASPWSPPRKGTDVDLEVQMLNKQNNHQICPSFTHRRQPIMSHRRFFFCKSNIDANSSGFILIWLTEYGSCLFYASRVY